jgi:hypothetical protein
MEYIKVDNHVVTELISTDRDPGAGWVPVMLEGGIYVGSDVRMYDRSWNLRDVVDLVQEGFIQLEIATGSSGYPVGTVLEKIKDGKIVKKTFFDLAKEGAVSLSPLNYLDEETETVKTAASIEEVLALGKTTQEQADVFKAALIREQRNVLLSDIDQIVTNPLRWGALSTTDKENFAAYRQALLDVPQQSGFPWAVVWPTLTS